MAARTTRPPLDEDQRRREVEARRAAYQEGLTNAERLRFAVCGFATALAIVGALAALRAFGG
jgi:hypothetical protein